MFGSLQLGKVLFLQATRALSEATLSKGENGPVTTTAR
jgi:hypothetical protein